MNYQQRIEQFCKKQCCNSKDCEYVLCNNTYRCDYLSGIMYGWELGQQDTIEEIEKLSKSLGDSEGFHYNFYVRVMKLVEQLKEK